MLCGVMNVIYGPLDRLRARSCLGFLDFLLPYHDTLLASVLVAYVNKAAPCVIRNMCGGE